MDSGQASVFVECVDRSEGAGFFIPIWLCRKHPPHSRGAAFHADDQL